MSRLMSVSLTEPQVRAGAKDVTRRLGWLMLAPGDRLTLCRKVMGRRKGEPLVRICEVEVEDVRRERLADITADDVAREGFPGWSPDEFVAFFCETHKGATPARSPASSGATRATSTARKGRTMPDQPVSADVVTLDRAVHEHLRNHLTDGRWHDDCSYCLARRRHGGNGVDPVEVCCAGLSATWCPIHGDCTCPRREDGEVEFSEGERTCPLHSIASGHASQPDGSGVSQ